MAAAPGKHVRVVVADDSLVAREMITQILASDPQIEVVGQAHDGEQAVELVKRLRPDLVTMDIHMPKMDGLEATERIMAFTPTPILVVSSSVHGEGMGRAFDALNLGALEVIKKPEPRDWADLERIGREVQRKVKILANVRVITHVAGRRDRSGYRAKPIEAGAGARTTVAVGSSTGGPSALLTVLEQLPADFPAPILVAQHIADGFVPGLVGWLDAGCKLHVVQAEAGMVRGARDGLPGADRQQPGARRRRRSALRRPDRASSTFPAPTRSSARSRARAARTPSACCSPAWAPTARAGSKRLHDGGAATIAQDEATSTVFGMPKAAIELGAADSVLPVEEIGAALCELVVKANKD